MQGSGVKINHYQLVSDYCSVLPFLTVRQAGQLPGWAVPLNGPRLALHKSGQAVRLSPQDIYITEMPLPTSCCILHLCSPTQKSFVSVRA